LLARGISALETATGLEKSAAFSEGSGFDVQEIILQLTALRDAKLQQFTPEKISTPHKVQHMEEHKAKKISYKMQLQTCYTTPNAA
jgi:hypothetical protein